MSEFFSGTNIRLGQHKSAQQQMRKHLDRFKYRLLDSSQEVTAVKPKPKI